MPKRPHNSATAITTDPRWQQVINRDASADGAFVYAVKTTGVYCYPSSPTRLPSPDNVEFFATPALAEAAGYRPSKRISSQTAVTQQHAALVADACRRITSSETRLSLACLARDAGLSTFHFHRVFKSVTGLTPNVYANAHRANQMRAALQNDTTVTQAIYDGGFNSSSHFYDTAKNMLGMTPSAYRAGGSNTDIRFAIGQCSLGAILVAQSAIGVCAIALGDDPEILIRNLQDTFPQAQLIGGDPVFEHTVAQVVGMIEAPATGLDLPLDIRGTAFQQRVWQALRTIPAGMTVTYTDIAQRIGAPKAVRAVANACASNVLAVAIPCHRVVRRDGELSGYRWGIERKRALLDREEPLSSQHQDHQP